MIHSLNSVKMEKGTVGLMIHLYCKKHHIYKGKLCSECEELREYALARLSNCRYGNNKPTCRRCKTHCYDPIMKEKIIKVMRFSGPQMIFFHPVHAFYYIIRKIRASE